MEKTKKIKCVICDYEWIPRVLVPKTCARCKSRMDWGRSLKKLLI